MRKKTWLGTMTLGLAAAALALGGCGQSGTDQDNEVLAGEDPAAAEQSADLVEERDDEKKDEVLTPEEVTKAMEEHGLACTEESVDVTDVTSAWACGDGETQLLAREFTEPQLSTVYARDTLTVDACAVDGVKDFRWIMGGGSWIIYSENPEEPQDDLLDALKDELKFTDYHEDC